MSNFPNNSAYPQGGANGQYAVMTPPPSQEKKVLPLAYTAGGGLLVGVLAGLFLISSGSATKAVAANSPVEEDSKQAAQGSTDEADVARIEPAIAEPAIAEPVTAEPVDEPPVEEAAPEPEILQALVSFDVTPAEVLADLRIEVDGESISAQAQQIPLDPASAFTTVRVVAVASGYRDFEKSIKVKGDMRVPIKMRKVPAPTALKTPGDNNRRRKAPDKSANDKNTGSKSTGPGGLLDL